MLPDYVRGRFLFETEPGFSGDDYYVPNDTTAETPAEPVLVIPTSPSTSPAPVATTPAEVVYYTGAGTVVPQPVPRRAPSALPAPVVAGTARYTAADYAAALAALMPRGRAWTQDPGSIQAALLAGLAVSFARSDAAASGLLSGVMPGSVTELLGEWEATLGLPDPCAGVAPTIDQRTAQLRARFAGAGGQSRQRYLDFAAALGFVIQIATYAPFRVGQSAVGAPLASDAWTFVWGVTITAAAGSLGPDVLICELQAAKPAETSLIFLGSNGVSVLAAPDGQLLLGPDGNPLLV